MTFAASEQDCNRRSIVRCRPCISRHNDRSECNFQRSSGAEEAAALLSSPALAEVYHIVFPHTSRMRHACLVIAASANPEFAALAEHRPRTYSIMRRVRGARRYSASANRSSAFSKPGTGNREPGQRARPAGRLQHRIGARHGPEDVFTRRGGGAEAAGRATEPAGQLRRERRAGAAGGAAAGRASPEGAAAGAPRRSRALYASVSDGAAGRQTRLGAAAAGADGVPRGGGDLRAPAMLPNGVRALQAHRPPAANPRARFHRDQSRAAPPSGTQPALCRSSCAGREASRPCTT